jgi:ParB family chromosome partitioning protein
MARDPDTLAKTVVAQGLNVRQTERLVQGDRNGSGRRRTPAKDADTRALERELSGRIGLKVTLKPAGNGGTLSIAYHTLDQLDEVARRLRDGGVRRADHIDDVSAEMLR